MTGPLSFFRDIISLFYETNSKGDYEQCLEELL